MKICCVLTFWLYVLNGFSQTADLVMINGNIITINSPGDRTEALAILDAKIVETGKNEAIKKWIGASTKVIDLHGQTVVPGFNDVHQHPAPLYAWDKLYASLELDTVSSMQ